METIYVDTWEEFESKLDSIYKSYPYNKKDSFLFRGHASSCWKLETTLERKCRKNISLLEYCRFILIVKPKIESLTGKEWNIQFEDVEKFHRDKINNYYMIFATLPAYEYMVYLRHHGFPCPLLDWSKSPYTAAYFAVTDTKEDEEGYFSIYVYLEYIRKLYGGTGAKTGDPNDPLVQSQGEYIRTHRRHYLQQSKYTICTICQDNKVYFANHEDTLSQNTKNQEKLWKINIPSNQKKAFISKLETMNINSYSLFETEDKLMEHIYVSEVYLGNLL
jgi:hypothetical protein